MMRATGLGFAEGEAARLNKRGSSLGLLEILRGLNRRTCALVGPELKFTRFQTLAGFLIDSLLGNPLEKL